VTLALAGFFCLGRFLTPTVRRSKTLLSVARAELPAQGALVYHEARVALMREGDAVYALSLVCTHLGCTVQVTPTELVCPCHGSTFDRQGRVLKGPADRQLERYLVEQRGDFFEVVV
jgi:cytochrome b6-f complex iron-sulfur subunit